MLPAMVDLQTGESDTTRSRRDPGLKRLQALQEDLYHRLSILLPDSVSTEDYLESRVGDLPVLRLEVLERHKYTLFFRLTYRFEAGRETVQYQPNAHIRLYYDARVAEVTSFEWLQGIQRFSHPELPPKKVLRRSWRLNRALDKWLDYLLGQGHSVDSFKPAEALAVKPAKAVQVLTEV